MKGSAFVQQKHSENRTAMTLAACLWLGCFPLLQGLTYARITLDKWIIMLALCGTTLCFFAFDTFFRFAPASGGRRRLCLPAGAPRLPLLLAGLLLLWMVLSCLFSPYGPDKWWIGASLRREGLATQLCYLGLFACFALSRIRLKPLLFAASAGVALFCIVVMLQRSGGNPLGLYPAGRSFATNPDFQGTIGNIDMDTGYLCLLSGFFLHGGLCQFRAYRRTGLKSDLAALLSCSTGLLISVYLILTMQVQFGIISLSVLTLFTLLAFLPKKLRLPALILLLALALVVVWFWPGPGGIRELHEILHGRARLSFGSNRLAVWIYSLGLAGEHPLFGNGPDTFVLSFNRYLEDHGLSIPTEQDGLPLPDYFDNPHNEYIAQLLNHGLPAMLLLILLFFTSVMRRREACFPLLTPYSAAVLCYAVQAFFSFQVCLVAPMLWTLLGSSFQCDQRY